MKNFWQKVKRISGLDVDDARPIKSLVVTRALSAKETKLKLLKAILKQENIGVKRPVNFYDKSCEFWSLFQCEDSCLLCGKELRIYGREAFKPHGNKKWIIICKSEIHSSFFLKPEAKITNPVSEMPHGCA